MTSSGRIIAECKLTVETWFLHDKDLEWHSQADLSPNQVTLFRSVPKWAWCATCPLTQQTHYFGKEVEPHMPEAGFPPILTKLTQTQIDTAFQSWCQACVAQLSLGYACMSPCSYVIALPTGGNFRFPFNEVLLTFDNMQMRVHSPVHGTLIWTLLRFPDDAVESSSHVMTMTQFREDKHKLKEMHEASVTALASNAYPSESIVVSSTKSRPPSATLPQMSTLETNQLDKSVSHACGPCKIRKHRCNGRSPCERCTVRGLNCVQVIHAKRGRKPHVPIGDPTSSAYMKRKYGLFEFAGSSKSQKIHTSHSSTVTLSSSSPSSSDLSNSSPVVSYLASPGTAVVVQQQNRDNDNGSDSSDDETSSSQSADVSQTQPSRKRTKLKQEVHGETVSAHELAPIREAMLHNNDAQHNDAVCVLQSYLRRSHAQSRTLY